MIHIRAKYAALQPILNFDLPPPLTLARHQPELVRLLLEDDLLRTYPPAKNYQAAFWKRVVSECEKGVGQAEPEEELVRSFSS